MSMLAPPDQSTRVDAVRPGSWSISWRGLHFSEEDLTGQHLSVLSLIVGSDDFSALDIDPRNGHQRLMMMIAAFVVVRAAASANDGSAEAMGGIVAGVMEDVASAPVEEILGSITFG